MNKKNKREDRDADVFDVEDIFQSFMDDLELINEWIVSIFIDWIERWDTSGIACFVCDRNGIVLHSYVHPDVKNGSDELLSKLQPGSDGYQICRQQMNGIYSIPIRSEKDGQAIAHVGIVPLADDVTYSKFVLEQIEMTFCAELRWRMEQFVRNRMQERHLRYEKEVRRWQALFQAVESFHSNNDVEKILMEILNVVQTLYEDAEIELYLSQDLHNSGLPARLLTVHDDVENISTRAFLQGKLLMEEEADNSSSTIATPLSGKQGSYGVLQLKRIGGRFHDADVKFLSMLSDSAGTAFENAKLYEHTNMLVRELRLINEITRRLNQSLQARDIVYFAARELLKIFNADYSCILKYEKELNRFVVQASNLPTMIEEEFHPNYGYTGIVFKSKEAMIVSDYKTETVESVLMELTGSRSLIASPIIVNSEVIGVVLVTHREVNHFTYDNFKLIQVLSGHIGLALTNASLHAEVRRMAITDHLTGLYARHYLNEQISFMQKKDHCGTLILVDIDHFKQINDTYGHQVGDKILLQVSEIIRSSIRDSDIAARWGGEELALYLPQARIDHAVRVAERIRVRIAKETDPPVTISCGVSQWNWDDGKVSVENLFYNADMALYEAKRKGRNQVRTSHMDTA